MFLMPGAKALPPLRGGGNRLWTPVDVSGAGLAFTGVSAFYCRVGKICCATFIFSYPATADGTAASVGGFPFTAYAIAMAAVGTSTSTAAVFRLGNGSRQGNFFNSTFTAATNANLSGAVVRCSVTYLTA